MWREARWEIRCKDVSGSWMVLGLVCLYTAVSRLALTVGKTIPSRGGLLAVKGGQVGHERYDISYTLDACISNAGVYDIIAV